VLFLPGLGNRGAGFRRLADRLQAYSRPILVEYPTGRAASAGAMVLARQVLDAVGTTDAIIASSFGGMVGAHLVVSGSARGIAFVGSFTSLDQLGLRGPLIRLMGPIAVAGRPGAAAAAIAANRALPANVVPDIVPVTPEERRGVLFRALAIPREGPPPPLRDLNVSCLAIHGDQDWLVPVAVLPRLVATLPKGTPSHVVVGAGHVPYFTHADLLERLLRSWLKGIGEVEVAPVAASGVGHVAA
jgi:pimeloyl-ACP methyl ester carboxylesterase